MASPDLYAARPADRLAAALSVGPRAQRSLRKRAGSWPDHSPAAANAWLVMVTAKAPTWQDPVMRWPEGPPTVGRGHEGFYYPDPLGFWAEVRRWAVVIFRTMEPRWGAQEALALTGLVHLGEGPDRLAAVEALCRPQAVLFLDEPAWSSAGITLERFERHHITDPHRAGQYYEGFWGRDAHGRAVGKAPQHPTTHKLFRAEEMDDFLASMPRPAGLAA